SRITRKPLAYLSRRDNHPAAATTDSHPDCRAARIQIVAPQPEEVGFETKTAIALGQLRQAREQGVPVGIVLGDAGYGDECDFRVGVAELDLRYVLGIRPGTSVWPPGQAPLPPAPWSGRGRPPTRLRRSPEHQPVSVKDLALSLPSKAWRTVTWREGSQAELTSRFAARRVRPAHRDTLRS
ncbi:transposase, partial [Roseicella aerolata]